MSNSKNSSNISVSELEQLPLKGFRVEVKSDNPNYRKLIEGMGDGRFRVHLVKIKK